MIQTSQKAPLIYGLSFLANALIIYFLYTQYTGINSVSNEWKTTSEHHVNTATQLAEIERAFGYVGFIHHFKNYVIRNDERYYVLADQSFRQTNKSLSDLKQIANSAEDQQAIIDVERTLVEYHEKMLQIANYPESMSVKEVDEIVRVNDDKAQNALNYLRESIVPSMRQAQINAISEVESLRLTTMKIGLIIVPLFLISNIFIMVLLRKALASNDELNVIFNTSPDGIFYLDNTGKILQANAAAANLFGYSQAELQQLCVEDLIDPEIREKHTFYRSQFTSMEQAREMSERSDGIKGLRKDGSFVELRIAIATKEIEQQMRS
jgi:PAS domain S-box-containing protein